MPRFRIPPELISVGGGPDSNRPTAVNPILPSLMHRAIIKGEAVVPAA